MNDIGNVAGTAISSMYGPNSDFLMSSTIDDIELQSILDDIGFFENDEESMLLPTGYITGNSGARISPPASEFSYKEGAFADSLPTSETFKSGFVNAPMISSLNLAMIEQLSNKTSTDSPRNRNSLPVTVSSSSVASKVALKPLAPPPNHYYSTTSNSNFTPSPPPAPMPVSPCTTTRPLVVETRSSSGAPAAISSTSVPAVPLLNSFDAKPFASPASCGYRKRQFSDISAMSFESEATAPYTEGEREMRRERNRVHAKKSRQRKKNLMHTLEESLDELKEENSKLRRTIYQVIGKDRTNAILQQQSIESHNTFIDYFKNHRQVDKKTSTFLRGLRKTMQSVQTKREKELMNVKS